MSIKTHYIIRNLIQNSNINRNNFVNTKKTYCISKCKNKQVNFNKVFSREKHTRPLSFGRGPSGNGPNPPFSAFLLFITASSAYLASKINKKK
jgi:hypothetical protein